MRTYQEIVEYFDVVVSTIENIINGKYKDDDNFTYIKNDNDGVTTFSLGVGHFDDIFLNTKVDLIIPIYSHYSYISSWYSAHEDSFSTDGYETVMDVVDFSTINEDWFFQQSTLYKESDLCGIYIYSLMRKKNFLSCKFNHDRVYVLGKFGVKALLEYIGDDNAIAFFQ